MFHNQTEATSHQQFLSTVNCTETELIVNDDLRGLIALPIYIVLKLNLDAVEFILLICSSLSVKSSLHLVCKIYIIKIRVASREPMAIEASC